MKRTVISPIQRSSNPIVGGVDIGHVHLKAASLPRIRAFYVDILGFDVMAEMPSAIFLSSGNYHHHLAFNTWESEGGTPPPIGTTGLYHVAIRYPTRASLGDALHRLLKANWPLDGVNDHGTHEALYLRDPENNGLELYWDRRIDDWPRDEKNHIAMNGKQLDIEGLLESGKISKK